MTEVKRTKKKKQERTGLLDLTGVPNSQKFIEEFDLLCQSANSIIMVRSRELHRTCEFLFEYAVTQQTANNLFYVWAITDGWRKLNTSASYSDGAQPVNPNSTDALLQEIAERPDEVPEFSYDLYPTGVEGDKVRNPAAAIDEINLKVASVTSPHSKHTFVMFAPEPYFEMPDFQEQIRALTDKASGLDVRLILLCNYGAELPANLQNNVKIIDFLAPNAPELFEECKETLRSITIANEEDGVEMTEAQMIDIVQNGLGMSMFEFVSALTLGIVKQTDDIRSSEDLDHREIIKTIINQKSEVVRTSQCLELIQPVDIAKVGGLERLKEYLIKRKRAFSHEARAFGVDAPRGIMCCGVPGTGKSLIAKAASYIFGIPCVGFDIGKVFGGLVGQSESQMRNALAQIDAMAPCVVFMDEVDKGFSGMGSSGGDGGTSARVFGTMLTWMQERRDDVPPVYVIMTANNVENLPPELLRKGRLDEIFFLTFPTPEERKIILNIHLEGRGHELPDEELEDVISLSENFVGAEIESVVKDAVLEAFNEGMEAPTGELLSHFATKLKPMHLTFPERIKKMNEWAVSNATPASDEKKKPLVFERPATAKVRINRKPNVKRSVR